MALLKECAKNLIRADAINIAILTECTLMTSQATLEQVLERSHRGEPEGL